MSKYGVITINRILAIRRRAMKRWLRGRGISIPSKAMYSESALRKLVRDHSAQAQKQGSE